MKSTLYSVMTFVLTTVLTAAAAPAIAQGHGHDVPESLVRIVREVTEHFADVDLARAAGYGPFLGCVSAPEIGAMGQHFVNGSLVTDGVVDARLPEALIYEPQNGRMHLVGVEYIVPAAPWNTTHTTPPVLEGQTFHYVGSPNRYGIDAFYELHVWAWRSNPHGTFVDWNPEVRCGR